jgi:hypothetical protein
VIIVDNQWVLGLSVLTFVRYSGRQDRFLRPKYFDSLEPFELLDVTKQRGQDWPDPNNASRAALFALGVDRRGHRCEAADLGCAGYEWRILD